MAEVEGVTRICVEAAVASWHRRTIAKGVSWFPPTVASTWRTELKKLPAKWISLIMDSMQTKKCSLALTTFFAAGCLNFVMSCYGDLDEPHTQETNTSSCGPDSDQVQLGSCDNQTSVAVRDHPSLSSNQQNGAVNSPSATTPHKALISEEKGLLPDLSPTEGSRCPYSSQIEEAAGSPSYHCPLSSQTEKAALRAYFELFLTYIPNSVLTLKVPEVTASWFASIIRFADTVVPHAVRRPLSICAAVYDQLVLNDIHSFNPELLVVLNNMTQERHEHLSVAVEDLTDKYLNYRAQRGTVTACQFAALLMSTSWCPRVSYDSPFQALEKLLEADSWIVGGKLSQSDIMKAIEILDFKKLSQEALERASKNIFIPKEVTLEAAVSVCSQLRDELWQTKQQLQSTKDANQQNLSVHSQLRDELQQTGQQLQSMRDSACQWKSEAVRLQDANQQKENKLQELQSYPRKQLQGSWVAEEAASWRGWGHRGGTLSTANQLVITMKPTVRGVQATQQSSFELRVSTSPYNEVESVKAPRSAMAAGGDSKCRDFVVKPGYFLPLGSSFKQVWEDWSRGQGAQAQDGIPPYVVYDVCSDSLYSPLCIRSHGGPRLIQWKRLPHEKK